ncbi:MAG TPA: TonB-dependent receptor [Candidatus Binatia bacterium]|nr:TonB-dependent receptor [Candidatus Binatia bacterium]
MEAVGQGRSGGRAAAGIVLMLFAGAACPQEPAGDAAPPAEAAAAPPPAEKVPVEESTAAAPRDTTVLEDIVVTSQKRVQSIQQVPISVTAMTGQMLWEQGATDVREALQFVPNARVDQAGFFAAPRVRGFTLNNNNKSFEPPVGMVLDGIPHTRVEYFMAALMDLERMEVLRGPQGTSFGKNTTGGLIHLISNPASSSSQGLFTLETGEAARHRIEAAYGGPALDGLNFRVAGLLDERGGFIRNTTAEVLDSAPREIKDRRRTALRLTAEMPELLGMDLVLAHERFQLHDGGAALENILSGPNFQATVRTFDPNADFVPGNWVQSQDYPDFKDVDIQRTRFQLERGIGAWELVALGAYSVMDQNLSLDTDFTPAPGILGSGRDHSPETYAEIRFTAPTLEGLAGLRLMPGSSELLFGLSGGRRQILDSHFRFAVNNRPFFALVGAAGADTGNPPDPGSAGGIIGGVPQAGTDKLDELDQSFVQTSDELSGFAHLQYRFLKAWAVELGGRYTTEKKHGDWNLVFTTPEPNASLRAIGTEEFTATRELDLQNFQPKISLNWDVTKDLATFLHWERGYKGGGFNAFALREGTCDGTPADSDCQGDFAADDLTFKDEVAQNIGLDFKSWWLGHTLNLNVSLFRETAKNFQVLIRENPAGTIGLGTSRVVNAEEARAQGVEADLRWLATSWLTVNGGLGILDTEFVSFKQGECPVGNSHKDTDGDGNPACDQSGKPFPFAPKIGGALGLRLNWPLDGLLGAGFGGLALAAGTVAEYESSQYLDIDLEDKKLQKAYTRFRADLGITSLPHRWTVRLVGENLTNTVTWVREGDVFENVVHGSQNQPRLFYVQLRQEF